MKINWMSNSPWVASGYGCQTRIFVPRIIKLGYEMVITSLWGLEGGVLNWNGIPVYPKGIGQWSNDVAAAHTVSAKAQILLTLFDSWPLQPENLQQFGVRWIPWFPIDMDPVPPPIVRNVTKAFDRIVFSKFALKEMERVELACHYVPHGIETDVFRPLDMAESRKAIGWPQDKFIIGMVAANKGQPARKALAEHLMAFAKLCAKHDDVLLYLHTSAGTHGEYGGINLPEMAEQLGITKSVVYCDQYNYHLGFPDQYMVSAYNSMDVHALCSMGEGFGIPIVEAQACGCPVIVGDWTATGELCFSGWKMDKKDTARIYTQLGSYQFIPDVNVLYELMETAYRFKGNNDYRKRARDGALAFDADKVTEKYWKPVLKKIEESIEDKTPVKLVKL
jgi:glycosyltransferase involved in cell wall biosynthesis